MKGIFISFEGIEGTGKSTQSKLLHDWFTQKGRTSILTEEPGGTNIGTQIRKLLLSLENKNMVPITELLLYNASRSQHIYEVIMPAIEIGNIVITDRFSDSTFAYQGYGRGLDIELIVSLDRIATVGLRPYLTILLDLDVETGLQRNRGIHKKDRLELEDVEFHTQVRNGFLALAEQEPSRIKLVDASGSIHEVHEKIIEVVKSSLGNV
jgi:dTMP kinase